MRRVLLADIGGTYARFAMLHGDKLGPVRSLHVRAHATMTDALKAFLAGNDGGPPINAAILAVAGPIESGRCAFTNSSWVADASALQDEFAIPNVRIVNDQEAAAWGLSHFTSSDTRLIGPDTPMIGAPMALLSPGTGLGMACLVPGTPAAVVIASEGGHATLAATDAAEAKIIDFLHGRHGHVSAERVLSGRGLMSLHEALSTEAGDGAPAASPEQIVREAIDGSSETARRALDMFCAFLGSVAGSAALTFGARGGVLIAGGIAPRIIEPLRRSSFRERFESKGRLRGYLAHIPTKVVTRRDPAFLGLMALANERR